jgi:hypothetical protein
VVVEIGCAFAAAGFPDGGVQPYEASPRSSSQPPEIEGGKLTEAPAVFLPQRMPPADARPQDRASFSCVVALLAALAAA